MALNGLLCAVKKLLAHSAHATSQKGAVIEEILTSTAFFTFTISRYNVRPHTTSLSVIDWTPPSPRAEAAVARPAGRRRSYSGCRRAIQRPLQAASARSVPRPRPAPRRHRPVSSRSQRLSLVASTPSTVSCQVCHRRFFFRSHFSVPPTFHLRYELSLAAVVS